MSRPVERIDTFLDTVDWYMLVNSVCKNRTDLETIEVITKKIEINFSTIYEYWHKYPDQRIVQVLVNLELIPYILTVGNSYYYKEDWEILEEQGCDMSSVLLWGTYGLDRKKFKWVLVKDMALSHIQAIITDFERRKQNLHPAFVKVFKKELEKDFKQIG